MVVVVLCAILGCSLAFTPLRPGRTCTLSTRTRFVTSRRMSQWDDEDEIVEEKTDKTVISRTTFDEAGESLRNEEDDERLNQMGDYDANPAVS